MSAWNHSMCEACWAQHEPNRWPVRVIDLDTAYICCFCGITTYVGIFVREDPNDNSINRCFHDIELRRGDRLDGFGCCGECGYEFTYPGEGCNACINRKVLT